LHKSDYIQQRGFPLAFGPTSIWKRSSGWRMYFRHLYRLASTSRIIAGSVPLQKYTWSVNPSDTSGTAQRIAAQRGYENTYNMAGGMLAWRREGLPVVSGD
jgi:hypothetical protein